MQATQAINTPERPGIVVRYPLAASTKVYAGTLGALNSGGFVVPAADVAGLRTVGRIEETIDNTDGADGGAQVDVKEGVFQYENSEITPVVKSGVGAICFVSDDTTVAASSTHKVKAGRVIDVDNDGVWIDVRIGQAASVPLADSLTSISFSPEVTQLEAENLRSAILAVFQGANLVK